MKDIDILLIEAPEHKCKMYSWRNIDYYLGMWETTFFFPDPDTRSIQVLSSHRYRYQTANSDS